MFVGPIEAAAIMATGLGTNLVMPPKTYFAWGCFSKNLSRRAPSPCREGRLELIDENVGVAADRGSSPPLPPI